jgi:DNA-directed RNA polymerase specialized sigma24 family protein
MGLLTAQERRRQGQKNLPNVVRIVSREWLQWIKRGGRAVPRPVSKSIGFKKTDPTDKKLSKREEIGIPPTASEPRPGPESLWKTEEGLSALRVRLAEASKPRFVRQSMPRSQMMRS